MDTKTCKACNVVKPLSEFYPSKVIKDGYENKCKECRRKQRKTLHRHTCEYCGNTFTSARKNSRFCSDECSKKSRRKRVEVICKYCGKTFFDVVSRANSNRYCSKECLSAAFKEMFSGDGNPNYKRVKTECDGCGKEIDVVPYRLERHKFQFCSYECYKENIGKFYTDESNPNYNRIELKCYECGTLFKRIPSAVESEKTFCSDECRKKFLSRRNRQLVGEKHPNWKKEKPMEERIIGRWYLEYKIWRSKVINRDKKCQKCGSRKRLVAHHILNYSEYPSLRTEVSNGITLCKTCHDKFHKIYGVRNNNYRQIQEFFKESR